MSSDKLRFAMFGTGFWSYFQLAGWLETGEVECVALYNRTKSKAEKLAAQFGIPQSAVYDSAEALLDNQKLDFVDICTAVELHYPQTKLAAERGLPVVCQKPMATTLEEAEALVGICKQHNVPLYINENWRWQHAIRAFKAQLDKGHLGRLFRAHIDYRNSFPVFDNQPFLKELEQFILTDIGSHILDTARFLFGDATTLYAHTHRVTPGIKGEDSATAMMTMGGGMTVVADMSYATRREHDRFPETYLQVEGEYGFLELAPDFWIRETTAAGVFAARHKPPRYAWADPAYDVAHSSIVPAQWNIARALKGLEHGETNGDDNLKTVRLVFGSYESARTGRVLGADVLLP
ncbi:MAG: Gfo/Idh/MocA family oxidoreductase [Chloroflexi bacterium]|nr:Gfo/Idh/MocA family oxidoreductase [Chloroflexota bacterium]